MTDIIDTLTIKEARDAVERGREIEQDRKTATDRIKELPHKVEMAGLVHPKGTAHGEDRYVFTGMPQATTDIAEAA